MLIRCVIEGDGGRTAERPIGLDDGIIENVLTDELVDLVAVDVCVDDIQVVGARRVDRAVPAVVCQEGAP